MGVTSSPLPPISVTSFGGDETLLMPSIHSEIQDDQSITSSTTGKVIIGILLSLVILLSIFGNVLVCLAVCTDRNLRKIGNLFVVSLAIADLFVACLVMIFALVNDLLGYWPFGAKYCDNWMAFDVMCSTASILNLCAISFDRYIHIKDPLQYGLWMTKWKVTLSIGGIWLTSALVSFLPMSLDLHQPQQAYEDIQELQIVSNQCQLDLTLTYAIVSSSISFFFPCMVTLFLYSKLYLYAKKHVAAINQFRPVTLGTLEGENNRPRKVAAPYHVSESKAAKTVGIIVGTFLVCWVPFFVINIVGAYDKDAVSPTVFKVLTWCGYFNSSLNPIIYSIFNQEFREGFRRILMVKCHMQRVMCCSSCKKYRRNSFDYYSTPRSSAVVMESADARCCPAFSSCCSACSCYCYCCSWCCGLEDPARKKVKSQKPRPSEDFEGVIQIPPRHENGSPSIVTEYKELDITCTPKIIYEKSLHIMAEETRFITEDICDI